MAHESTLQEQIDRARAISEWPQWMRTAAYFAMPGSGLVHGICNYLGEPGKVCNKCGLYVEAREKG